MQHHEPTVTQKECKKCKVLKHASEFCKSKWGVDGLHSRCAPPGVHAKIALPVCQHCYSRHASIIPQLHA